jgi:hypothetical protein
VPKKITYQERYWCGLEDVGGLLTNFRSSAKRRLIVGLDGRRKIRHFGLTLAWFVNVVITRLVKVHVSGCLSCQLVTPKELHLITAFEFKPDYGGPGISSLSLGGENRNVWINKRFL